MLVERNSLRVGDAEREAAASALGDHLVAGRLTVAEYEERAGRAWAAQYFGELTELFADLPAVRSSAPVRRRGPRPFVLEPVLFTIMAVVMVIAVVNILPWLFLLLLGMFAFSHGRRRRYRHWNSGHANWNHARWS